MSGTSPYIDPVYTTIQRIGSLLGNIKMDVNHPTSQYHRSNVRTRKTSSGKHLCSFYARKRRHRQRFVISGSNISKIDEPGATPKSVPPCSHPVDTYSNYFCPINDPSCQDTTWYDAISPYWTEGMVWNCAYVLNHQVVSVTTDPIFVSNLNPALELSATIQTPGTRSEGENVGPRATIALDSGSSIPVMAPILGVHFWGSIFPSKMGPFAPFSATIQALSRTRAFLQSKNEQKLLCMGRTFTVARTDLLHNCPFQLSFSWESNRALVKASERGAKCYLHGCYFNLHT
jgi:hypothetical protein